MANEDQPSVPDLKTIFANPKFRKASAQDKIQFLDIVNPKFQALPSLKDKADFIQAGLNGIPMQPKHGINWSETGQALLSVAKSLPGLVQFVNPDPVSAARAGATVLPEIGRQGKEQFQKAGELYTQFQQLDRQAQENYKQAEQLRKQGREREARQHEETARESEKISSDYGRGAFGYGLAGVLPVVGPAAAQAGEQWGEKRYGPAAVNTLALLAPQFFRPFSEVGPFIKESAFRPAVQREAIEQFKKRGGQVSLGQEVGSPQSQTQGRLEKVERHIAPNLPGSTRRAEEFFGKQEIELERQARESAAKAAPTALLDYQSGKDALNRLQNYVLVKKAQADRMYNLIRKQAAAFKQTVQTGTKTVPGPNPAATLHPSGMPRQVPVYATLETPADLTNIRKGLSQVYEELSQNLPDLRKQSSPGWTALNNLMTSDKQFMNALDLDKNLGAVKELMRRSKKSNLLTTRAEAVGFKVIDAAEKELETTLNNASPGLKRRLDQARGLVKEYHDADELIEGLSTEPAKVYEALTIGGDKAVELLKRINALSPQTIRTLGRTYLEGLIKKATEKGGFKRAAGVYKGWTDLGPETKNLMFGPQLTKELDNFFTAADRLAPAEGSATTGRWAAMTAFGGVLITDVIRAFITGGPAAAAKEAAGGFGISYVLPNIGARIAFTPGGVRLMTQALKLPTADPGFRLAMTALAARAQNAVREEREDRQAAGPAAAAAAAPPRSGTPGSPVARGVSVKGLADEIERYEKGVKPNSRAERNRNPGNLKVAGLPRESLSQVVGKDAGGFAIFPDYASGRKALEAQVRRNMHRGLTLNEFFAGAPWLGYAGYAPARDGNRPLDYAKTVGGRLGINPSQPLNR